MRRPFQLSDLVRRGGRLRGHRRASSVVTRCTVAGSFLLLLVATLGLSGLVAAHVVVQSSASSVAGGKIAPFRFANPANYAPVLGLGIQTNSFPNAAATSVQLTLNGYAGSSGTYALDTLEVETVAATTVAWSVHLDVSVPMVASGVNTLWVSYCNKVPSAIPASGTPLASGTDASGNPWAVFAPTCPVGSIESSLELTGAGPTAGAVVTVAAGTGAAQPVLYLSFLWAVGSTGVTTTTPAVVSIVYEA